VDQSLGLADKVVHAGGQHPTDRLGLGLRRLGERVDTLEAARHLGFVVAKVGKSRQVLPERRSKRGPTDGFLEDAPRAGPDLGPAKVLGDGPRIRHVIEEPAGDEEVFGIGNLGGDVEVRGALVVALERDNLGEVFLVEHLGALAQERLRLGPLACQRRRHGAGPPIQARHPACVPKRQAAELAERKVSLARNRHDVGERRPLHAPAERMQMLADIAPCGLDFADPSIEARQPRKERDLLYVARLEFLLDVKADLDGRP
jgi:hypothetical protein